MVSHSSHINVSPTTILVVEDDAPTRAVICQSLSTLGFNIVEAGDGLEAKEYFNNARPDLLITDLMMPKLSGIELVRWLRETYPEPFLPVLMLTALGEVDDKVQGFAVGADDYLSKPFHYRELLARVEALLRIRKLTDELYYRGKELLAANEQLTQTQAALVAKERELVAAQMAGAAAHNLGQPVTAILLHCRLLEKSITTLQDRTDTQQTSAGNAQLLEETWAHVKSIRRECETISAVIGKLHSVDTSQPADYVGGAKILDIK